MFYLYFFLQLLGIALLSPVRWAVNFFVKYMWKDFEVDLKKFKIQHKTDLQTYAEQIKERIIKNLDKIMLSGDSAKFIAMLTVSSDDEKVLRWLFLCSASFAV